MAVVDGAPVGENGRIWGCPEADKAFKVPFEAARFLLDHLAYSGVVRVDEINRPDGTGTDLDLKKARAESLARFEAEDARRWREYVEYCLTDKMDKKKAIPPTPDSIKRIMDRRGYRASDFGILPIGEQGPMDKQFAIMQQQINELTAALNEALGGPVTKGKK